MYKLSSTFKLSLLGKEFSPVPFAKDLGVFMDSILSFDEHVMQITSKCIASLCQINRVRHVLDKKTLITVINALVFSRLFYCSSVLGGISMKNVLELQSVQNFATCIIPSARKYDHIQLILRDLHWLNVESTIKYRDRIMAFKCMNGYAPEYLCHQFISQSKIHSWNTRNKDNLAIPLCKTAAGQKNFVYHATSIWNSLSQELINLNNPNCFKRLYKLSLLEQ